MLSRYLGVVAFGLLFMEPAYAQVRLATCFQAPLSIVPQRTTVSTTRTDCNPQQARRKALTVARNGVVDSMRDQCLGEFSAAERRAVCAAAGLRPVPDATRGPGMGGSPGNSSVDAVVAINARTCIALTELPGTFRTRREDEPICIFDGFKRTIFTGAVRGRCGVQCL